MKCDDNLERYDFILDWYKIKGIGIGIALGIKTKSEIFDDRPFTEFILTNNLLDYDLKQCYTLYLCQTGVTYD
jgi:hypothetical protein